MDEQRAQHQRRIRRTWALLGVTCLLLLAGVVLAGLSVPRSVNEAQGVLQLTVGLGIIVLFLLGNAARLVQGSGRNVAYWSVGLSECAIFCGVLVLGGVSLWDCLDGVCGSETPASLLDPAILLYAGSGDLGLVTILFLDATPDTVNTRRQ
jgi:hypothetical protein